MNRCPLCLGRKTSKIDVLYGNDIQYLYKRWFAINLTSLADKKIYLCKCKECGLLYFHPNIAGDAELYDRLQKYPWYYSPDKNEYSNTANYINRGDSVLDVGCGNGNFSKYLRTKNYTGIDISEKAVQDGQKLHRKVIQSSLDEYVNTHCEIYDVVCSFQVFEHVADPYTFISNMVKCLKKDGTLIISVPSYDSFLQYTFNNVLNIPPHHLSWWPDKTLYFIANKFNLTLKELYHEPLAKEHTLEYTQTIILSAFMRKFHIRQKTVRMGLFWRIATTLANLVARGFAGVLNDETVAPRGESVTVVFQKI
jgi:2-polyprenyl-3-methyl-5-hydroxy-6-metoxy-1,4-benzoquinol methylase